MNDSRYNPVYLDALPVSNSQDSRDPLMLTQLQNLRQAGGATTVLGFIDQNFQNVDMKQALED